MKTCLQCSRNKNKETPAEDQDQDTLAHDCSKNWTLSSQAMEAAIIVAGFQKSLQDHGLIYRYVVGDADSSVFKRIQTEVHYLGRLSVEKIDCKNHAVRGINSKLYHIVGSGPYAKKDQDYIKSRNINR